MIHVPGAGFCDDQLPVLSTIGRGPVGPQGEKGDKGDPGTPTFADPLEWDGDREYEQNTIVLHEGNSYVSIVPVPAGIDISDDTYWALAANYNAQIEQYRQELEGYKQETDLKFPVTENNIANGAVTENKLSLELRSKASLFLTPEQYGAVGDGITDDTQAFKDMLDDIVYDTVIVLHPFHNYLISETLNIDKGQIGIVSLADLEYKPAIIFTSDVSIGFYVTGFSFCTDNINIKGQSPSHEITLMKFDFDSTSLNGNVDATISNTAFIDARRGIEILGRNIHIHHCLLSQITQIAIHILQTQNITTAIRGYDIEHNRFHDCKYAIENDVTNYVDEGCSVKVSDNYMDGGAVLYTGTSDNVFITGNYVSRIGQQYTNIVNLVSTCKEESMCVVEGNFVNGTQSYSGEYPRSFVNIAADCFGTFVIVGNSFNSLCALTSGQVALITENSTHKTIVVFKNNTLINRVNQLGVYFTGATNIYGVASGNVINGTVTASANSHVSISDNTNINAGI